VTRLVPTCRPVSADFNSELGTMIAVALRVSGDLSRYLSANTAARNIWRIIADSDLLTLLAKSPPDRPELHA
jgi:hypothetical protein